MAHHILPLLKARFGRKVKDWFQHEAHAEAAGVTWDSVTQKIVHSKEQTPESESPLHGSNVAPQNWEVLEDDDFDCALDTTGEDDATAEITFDLKYYFSLQPRDPQGTEGVIETESQGSFRTNTSAATLTIQRGAEGQTAAAAMPDGRDGGAEESHDENSRMSDLTGTSSALSGLGKQLPQSSGVVQQTPLGGANG